MPAPSARYAFGPFVLDAGERRLARLGAPVPASAQTLDLLALLARHAGRLVTKDALMGALWPGTVPEENALTVAVSKLRAALGADGRALVETVRGRGYRLATPVTVEDGAAGPRALGLGGLRTLAVRPFAALAADAAPLAAGLHEAIAAALAALGVDARPAPFDAADAVLAGDV